MQLAMYSLGHFAVDFACALLLFSRLSGTPDWALCMLLYNFCAFALQMPIGLEADRLSRNSSVAALGCALTAAAWPLASLPLLCAVTAGLGNACFHVGGGIDVLNRSTKHSAALGVYVSPGAFGIFFGTLLGRASRIPAPPVMLALLAFGGLFLLVDLRRRGTLASGNAPLDLSPDRAALWALAACLLVVVLRSYVGMILAFPWKTGVWPPLVTCALVLGKASGGFLADAMGIRRAAVLSFSLSAVLFLFSSSPVAGTLAVFLFNMSMPMTLWAAAKLLPGARGFAFGTLTFALFLGFLPVWLRLPALLQTGAGYALGCVASMALLVAALRKGAIQ